MAARFLLQGANGFARFVTWVSLLGLVLGVSVTALVVNVMNGFDHELRQRCSAVYTYCDSSADAIGAYATSIGRACRRAQRS